MLLCPSEIHNEIVGTGKVMAHTVVIPGKTKQLLWKGFYIYLVLVRAVNVLPFEGSHKVVAYKIILCRTEWGGQSVKICINIQHVASPYWPFLVQEYPKEV